MTHWAHLQGKQGLRNINHDGTARAAMTVMRSAMGPPLTTPASEVLRQAATRHFMSIAMSVRNAFQVA